MKSLRFRTFGSPDVLSIEEAAIPEPGPGEVLVHVEAAGLNPSDVKNVSGVFKATTLPRTPGRDFAGEVVSGLRRGLSVWGSVPGFGNNLDGTHAEYVVVPEPALSARPANLTAEQAAAAGVPYTTAWGALMRAAEIREGETILIIGAAGAVGQAAIQIANWKRLRVLGATRGGQPSIGASATVDTSSADFPTRVFELTGGKGAEIVFDTVGGPMFDPALSCLAKDGRQIAISSTGGPRVSFNLVDFYHNRSRLIGFDSYGYRIEDMAGIFDELRAGFEANALTPPQIEVTPFGQAIAAYKAVAAGRAGAKIVFSFA